MIDKNELKRLAESIHGSGSTMHMLARWREFEHACEPKLILALIAENERLQSEAVYAAAGFDAAREEVSRLKAENEALRRELVALKPAQISTDKTTVGYTGCLICGKYTDHGGLQCPNLAARSLQAENQRIAPVDPIRVLHPLDSAITKGKQS